MGTAATKRTRAARGRTRPDSDEQPTRWEGRPGFFKAKLTEELQTPEQSMMKSLIRRLEGKRRNTARHQPKQGERSLRKNRQLAERRAARERAYANGKRRG